MAKFHRTAQRLVGYSGFMKTVELMKDGFETLNSTLTNFRKLAPPRRIRLKRMPGKSLKYLTPHDKSLTTNFCSPSVPMQKSVPVFICKRNSGMKVPDLTFKALGARVQNTFYSIDSAGYKRMIRSLLSCPMGKKCPNSPTTFGCDSETKGKGKPSPAKNSSLLGKKLWEYTNPCSPRSPPLASKPPLRRTLARTSWGLLEMKEKVLLCNPRSQLQLQ